MRIFCLMIHYLNNLPRFSTLFLKNDFISYIETIFFVGEMLRLFLLNNLKNKEFPLNGNLLKTFFLNIQ